MKSLDRRLNHRRGLARQRDCGIVGTPRGDAIDVGRGWVAQLAEQRTENPRVGGSIPPPATVALRGTKN